MSEQEFMQQIELNKNVIHNACNAYCQSLSHNDLIQDIIAETWKSLGKFKNSCKFSTWLHTIARNVCISALRKHKSHPIIEGLDDYIDVLEYVDTTPELIKQLHEAKRYNIVTNTIEEPYRTLFHMYVYGASFKDLEQHSGINANVLRVNMHRIKKRLQLRYGNKVI